jgi:hypothetical protein
LTFGTYLLRPAAGGWIFPEAPITVDLQQTEVRVAIQAQSTASSSQLQSIRIPVVPAATEAARRWQAGEKLLRISEPVGPLGTGGNRRGLPHGGVVIIHLAALSLEPGGLVVDESSAMNITADDIRLRRIPVLNAKVELLLWLRRGDHYVVGASASANTDAGVTLGLCSLRVSILR